MKQKTVIFSRRLIRLFIRLYLAITVIRSLSPRIFVNQYITFTAFCQPPRKPPPDKLGRGFVISGRIYFAFLSALPDIILMTTRVAIISAMAMGRQMSQFWIKPEMMKETKETAATVMA